MSRHAKLKPGLGALTRIDIPVADLERAIAWYRDRLGFDLAWKDDEEAFVTLTNEGIRFFLIETKDEGRLGLMERRKGVANGAVDFYAEDLDELHRTLKERGVAVDALRPDGFGFGFEDLDGNRFGVHRDRGSYQFRHDPGTE